MPKQYSFKIGILIFKLSVFILGFKKFSLRFSIEWGWDN